MSFEDQLRRFPVDEAGEEEPGELSCPCVDPEFTACSGNEMSLEDGVAMGRFLAASLGAS
jgi:hypothetical protein